jgi:hypothetical protein
MLQLIKLLFSWPTSWTASSPCFFPIFLYICLFFFFKTSFFIYKLLLFDVSEIKEFLEKNNKKKFILCGYGHTSWKDNLFAIISAIKIGNIKGLTKYKYKPIYPKCIHKYLHFIKNNTTKITFYTNLALFIEGTRIYTNRVRTGFIYLAKNNNAEIVFFINNYKKNKIEFSKITYYNDDDTLVNLKQLIHNIPKSDYSFYPDCCSDINL